MRTLRRISLTLLMTLALATPAVAQDERVTFNAAVGPSFSSLGTTVSTAAGVDVKLNDRTSVVGEFGVLPHAPFQEAIDIAPAVPDLDTRSSRVNAYHWNGNLRVRPFEFGKLEPYVTGGIGSFTADAIVSDQMVGTTRVEDRRRVSDFATNVGAGLNYHFNDWVGIGADYRTFFVHRDDTTPRVNRFTAGLTFSVK